MANTKQPVTTSLSLQCVVVNTYKEYVPIIVCDVSSKALPLSTIIYITPALLTFGMAQ